MRRAYLDHAATSPLGEAAAAALARALPFGNASSVHAEGRAARAVLDEARERMAAAAGVHADEIVFTGSGTEADNLALRGVAWAARGRPHLVISGIEHEAVRRTARFLASRGDADVTEVAPGMDGVVDAEAVAGAIRSDTRLVSVMAVNNEVGTIQPLAAIGAACVSRGVLLHVDAVQAPGRVALDLASWGAGLASLSAHKAGGPKGLGVLVARRGVKLAPALTGGEQEGGLRPGTENAGLALAGAVALEEALGRMREAAAFLADLGRRLERGLLALPGVTIHGATAARAPGFVSAAFAGCEAITLVHALDLAGFAVSSGSACSSGSVKPSHVLAAMGLPAEACRSSLRFSLGPGNDASEIDALLAALPGILARSRTRDG